MSVDFRVLWSVSSSEKSFYCAIFFLHSKHKICRECFSFQNDVKSSMNEVQFNITQNISSHRKRTGIPVSRKFKLFTGMSVCKSSFFWIILEIIFYSKMIGQDSWQLLDCIVPFQPLLFKWSLVLFDVECSQDLAYEFLLTFSCTYPLYLVYL